MFVIVHQGYVISGPKKWNKKGFEEVLVEDCEVEYTLETRNDSNLPIVINEDTKILPVVALAEPNYNAKIQRLDGPYWNFYDDRAEMYFTVGNLEVDAVRNKLKEIVANNRYVYEVKGIKVEVQGNLVTIDTARGSRDIFFSALISMGDSETINWKFPEMWLTVTKSDMTTIVAAGKQHIQDCFTWEQNKSIEIDAATSLEELDAIVLNIEENA